MIKRIFEIFVGAMFVFVVIAGTVTVALFTIYDMDSAVRQATTEGTIPIGFLLRDFLPDLALMGFLVRVRAVMRPTVRSLWGLE